MIGRRRLPPEERAQQNVFVSMTDLTISVLLIVVVVLAFIATQMRDTRLMETLENLQVQLTAQNSALDTLELETGLLQTALSQKTNEISRLSALLTMRDGALEDARSVIRRRTKDLAQANERLNLALKRIELVEADATQLAGVLADARSERDAIAEILIETRAHVDALDVKLSDTQRTLARARSDAEIVRNSYETEARKLRDQLAQTDGLLTEAGDTVDVLTAQKLQLTQDLDVRNRALQEISSKLSETEAERETLKRLLAAQVALTAEASDELAFVRERAETASIEHRRALKAFSDALKSAKTVSAGRNRQIAELTSERSAMMMRAETLEAEIVQLKAQRSKLVDQHERQAGRLRQAVADLEDRLTQVTQARERERAAQESARARMSAAHAKVRAENEQNIYELTRQLSQATRELRELREARDTLGLDLANAERQAEYAARRAQVMQDISGALRENLNRAREAQRVAAESYGEFRRALAAALQMSGDDAGQILAEVRARGTQAARTLHAAEASGARIAEAETEIAILEAQNMSLRATIQKLLSNSAKIAERLRAN